MRLALLHSPFVGAFCWSGLAPLLRARGHDVVVPKISLAGPPYYPRIAQSVADEIGTKRVLIAHSGAGALVPVIAQVSGARGAIFVDAILPHPGRSWFDTAPQALATHLRNIATENLLPVWEYWFASGTLARLLPDAAMRDAFRSELKPTPLAYCEENAPIVEFSGPCAYLILSEGYTAEMDAACAAGFAVAALELHHLAMLTHAAEVAAALDRLLAPFETGGTRN